jgi:hypothetical protein
MLRRSIREFSTSTFYPPTHNREPYDTPPRSTRESRKEAVHRIDVFREFAMRLQKNYRLYPSQHPPDARELTAHSDRSATHPSPISNRTGRGRSFALPLFLARLAAFLFHLAAALRPAQVRLVRTSVCGSSAAAEARFGVSVAGTSTLAAMATAAARWWRRRGRRW